MSGPLLPREVLEKTLSTYGVAGASIAVLSPTGDGDARVRTQVCGLACRESSTPMFDSTWLEIASLSKPLAAVYALQYFEARGISFDTGVNSLLADAGSPFRLKPAEGCPQEWADAVTLKHLVDHTGPQMHYVNGIPRECLESFPSAACRTFACGHLHIHSGRVRSGRERSGCAHLGSVHSGRTRSRRAHRPPTWSARRP